jgi:single-stranded-DNA-specific exonuclease
MKARIVRREPTAEYIRSLDHLHPLLARLYAARNVSSTDELECTLNRLHGTERLKDVERAAELLHHCLDEQTRILVIADFDTDGATSCAVAVRALRLMGARHVHFIVPNRFEYGYGLTPEIVAVAAQWRPDLIITVDNGISSIEGVAAARARGIRVLVTDHHLPGARLPDADVIVNPNQLGDGFPSKSLAGVGVIFYVMLALRARLRTSDWFVRRGVPEPNLAQLLDLVALGSVADLVPLDHNNRVLISQGLSRIRAGQCCAGIKALATVAGRRLDRLVAGDLGYALAPRLNAAGRLEDMGLGIECLLTDDDAAALTMAEALDRLNTERRQIELEMHTQAIASLDKLHLDAGDHGVPAGLCLFDDGWHQGVIGILASRIKERVNRPVIAFAAVGADELKGSARSVPGLHIRDTLEAVSARHPGLLTRFGGHAMAAGLTIRRDDLDAFIAAFGAEVGRRTSPTALQGIVYSDGELEPENHTVEIAEMLRIAGPWGQDFPEPVFDNVFEVIKSRVVGERHLKMLLKLPGRSGPLDAIAFNTPGDTIARLRQVHVAYKLDVNDYRGQRSAQLLVEHVQSP